MHLFSSRDPDCYLKSRGWNVFFDNIKHWFPRKTNNKTTHHPTEVLSSEKRAIGSLAYPLNRLVK